MNQSQPHRATLEQWCYLRQYLRLNRQTPDHIAAANASITLELAARIEALEATQHAHAERQDQPTSSRKRPITTDEELYRVWDASPNVAVALRAVYNLGRQRGAAQTTCPHIATSDEGTSYCRLAEQSATPATPMTELRAARSSWSPQRRPAPRPGLVGCSWWSMSMPMVMASEQACWVARNSRRVSPFQEFRTPEAAYAAHQARAEQAPEPVTPMDELRSASAEARPGGLVERVALALDSDCPQDEYVIKDCRAVIREVAAALLEWHDSDQIVHTAWEAAKWLQQEANHD